MRAALLASALLGGCRESCFPEIRGASASEASSILASVDLFLERLAPEYSVCVPRVEVQPILFSGEHRVGGRYMGRSREVLLARPANHSTIHHEFAHALDDQNQLPLLAAEWDVGKPLAPTDDPEYSFDPVAEGFAYAASVATTLGPLLRASCPGDGVKVATYQRASEYFLYDDLEPGPHPTDGAWWGWPGVALTAAPFVERMRAKADRVVDLGQSLALVDGVEVVATTSFVAEPLNYLPVGAGLPQTIVEETDADGVVAYGPVEWIDGGFERRVYRSEGVLRLLGDGCLRAGETTFVWGGRQWSTWVDGEERVVGFWDMP